MMVILLLIAELTSSGPDFAGSDTQVSNDIKFGAVSEKPQARDHNIGKQNQKY